VTPLDGQEQLQPPTRVGRLSDQVATQIQELVIESALKLGEKLPSERELSKLLGVSRTVVREAVRALVAKGLLEVRHGGGMIVRAPDSALVSEIMINMLRSDGDVTFMHVHEVRYLLEVEIAGLSAERRDDDDLLQMEGQLQAMVEHEGDPLRWAEADVAFHAAIAVATHNPLYLVLLNSIVEMLMELRLTAISLPDTPQKAYHHHMILFERIKAQDRPGARKAMRDHLRESQETFRKAHFTRRRR
jgi:GntR family transcriptional repressor for pyruvate dehydrogenase complex